MAANSLSSRLWQYQKERFPLFAHGILIASFTFSALAFSHICRQDTSDMSLYDFLRAYANTFCLFLLLRISDEFKDKDYDREKRPHLPVPRGLISLKELRIVGIVVLLGLSLFNLVFATRHVLIYVFVLCYLALMFREFFVKQWLEQHQLWYVVSHMMIIPLVDTLASSFDWMGSQADLKGLCWFFAVSFFNGCTLELGRKIKVAENEEANTYSFSLGFNKAMSYFQAVLFITFCLCIGAAAYAGLSWTHHLVFILLYILCAVFAIIYTKKQTLKNAKTFEKLSALWAVFTYLNLGLGLYF